MPLKENDPYCVNHPDQIMTRNTEPSAITRVDLSRASPNFIPNTGVPVRVFVCPRCGYVELYVEPAFIPKGA